MKIHPRHHVLEDLLTRLGSETRLLMRHLLSCRRCRTAALVVLENPETRASDDRASTRHEREEGFVSDELLEALERHRDEYEREQALAPSLIAELLGCLPEERRERVVEHERFHTAAFVIEVLEEGRERLAEQPFDGLELTELGREAAERLDVKTYGESVLRDLRARAWGYVGDAHRRCGDLPAAEQAFLVAELLLSETGDPLEEARFFQLKAALKRDQRSFEDSQRLEMRAERELRRCHQPSLA